MDRDYFGRFGGRYVAEVLRRPLDEMDETFRAAVGDPSFLAEVDSFARTYIGRPTPLLYAENLSKRFGGGDLYIKLEGLANTGAHKINNAAGQALLAKRMGKTRIIAETGAGQHGVAVAAVCAKLGLECTVYMGEVDIRRQRPNVFWMELYGAEVVPVSSGSRTLKDAVNEALRDWAGSFGTTHYLIGSALGPAPYPGMVRYFQSVVGAETAAEARRLGLDVRALVACVGGGSNAVGFFSPYLDRGGEVAPAAVGAETESAAGSGGGGLPRLIGVEAGGRGPGRGNHASRMTGEGRVGIVQGYKSYFLLDDDGQVQPTHSVSAGLDYPGIGPELARCGEEGLVEFTTAGDREAIDAVQVFAREEGIIFALESAHAGAAAIRLLSAYDPGQAIIVNMSGRGDKDLFICAPEIQPAEWARYLRDEAEAAAQAGPAGGLHGAR